ncbi:MAG: hypothetical protein M3N07_09160 [Pseudomonadota bacterium]|nr:hypothetical protein [Pseudomonadota bacterium]
MAPLQLTRAPGDRRLFELQGVGTLRMTGLLGRTSATAAAGERGWQLTWRGFLRPVVRAIDTAGAVVGEYEVRKLQRGGTLRWADRELELRSHSVSTERYLLVDGGRELATIDGRSRGESPLTITMGEPDEIVPGRLLFVAFLVRALAQDKDASLTTG